MKRKQKKILLRLILSLLLFIAALFLDDLIPYGFILYIAVYLLAGYDILLKAFKNIFHKNIFDENFLMAVATVGAFCLGEYHEAVMVVLLYQIGELFQSYAVSRSRDSIAALMRLRPDSANVLRGDEIVTLSPEEVAVGETVLVRCGERVPIDGVIAEGETLFDVSALTGEPMPVSAGVGTTVLSGSVNVKGTVKIVTEKPFAESTVSRILELTENVASAKAPVERFITKFAKYYTPAVVLAAVLLATIPPIFSGYADFTLWLHRALIFLVVSCPCAVVVSVPLGFFSGIGAASKKGILVKGAAAIEELSKVKTVLFDKTGTLTMGRFSLASATLASGAPAADDTAEKAHLLRLAAAGEYYSTHPIAEAIRLAYPEKIDPAELSECEEIAGKGTVCSFEGRRIAVGNGALMAHLGITYTVPAENGTTVYVAEDGTLRGMLILADRIKPQAKNTIADLQSHGIRCIMLTGDKKETAASVAANIGLDGFHAELLPADKVETAKQYKEKLDKNARLAFVGDGINDAPVLTLADVGVAMGGIGSDAALEAADAVVMNDDISKLSLAIRLSRMTVSTVRINIIFAFAVKALVLLLSALGLAGMWMAILADVGVCVIAILHSMSLLYRNRK